MIQPDKPARSADDDDFDLELPGEDDDDEESALREEESFLPDDDSDFGLDTEEKTTGLDLDNGLDDGESELDDGDDEDDASWLGDDGFDPVLTGEDDDEGDEEEALGEDSEPSKDSAEWDDELPFEEGGTPVADTGEEGFGEDAASSEIELEQLPPLDGIAADGDEPDEGLNAELLDELPIAAGSDEAEVEVAPGLRCVRVPAARVELETLARLDRPLVYLVATGDAALAWDGSLLVSSTALSSPRPERRFSGVRPSGLAALQTETELLVALAAPEGVLCSRDGGRTFTRAGMPDTEAGGDWVPSSIAWSMGAAGPRLLAAAPAGSLWASDDFGASWQPRPAVDRVLALHAGGARALVAVCRADDGGARALRSRDGGDSFDASLLPVRELERVQDAQALNGVVLCCRRAPAPQLVWRGQGDAWHELSAFASAPAALLDDDEDQVSAYFFVQTKERALLLRRVLAARASTPEIVCEFEHDAGTPLQLVAGHADGAPVLHVGTERGWYRVRIRPAGGSA